MITTKTPRHQERRETINPWHGHATGGSDLAVLRRARTKVAPSFLAVLSRVLIATSSARQPSAFNAFPWCLGVLVVDI
jgi:hypothetical protein